MPTARIDTPGVTVDLTEAIEVAAQAIRDANTPEAWTSPQLIPASVYAKAAVEAAASLIEKAALQRVLGSEDDPAGILDRYTVACAPNDPGKPLFFWHCARCNVVHVIARDLDGDQSGVTLAEMAESVMSHEDEHHTPSVVPAGQHETEER
jgi:hypothetical protein